MFYLQLKSLAQLFIIYHETQPGIPEKRGFYGIVQKTLAPYNRKFPCQSKIFIFA